MTLSGRSGLIRRGFFIEHFFPGFVGVAGDAIHVAHHPEAQEIEGDGGECHGCTPTGRDRRGGASASCRRSFLHGAKIGQVGSRRGRWRPSGEAPRRARNVTDSPSDLGLQRGRPSHRLGATRCTPAELTFPAGAVIMPQVRDGGQALPAAAADHRGPERSSQAATMAYAAALAPIDSDREGWVPDELLQPASDRRLLAPSRGGRLASLVRRETAIRSRQVKPDLRRGRWRFERRWY